VNSALMFSKASDEWETPQELFSQLHAEFCFDLDAAATEANAKVPMYYRYIDEDASGLTSDWSELADTVWLNPPYSRCAEFVAKAAEEAKKGVTTVMLIPSRTDTKYWHAHIWDAEKHQPRPGVEIRFLKGRLKFGNSKNSAPFPSVVVVFRGQR